MGCGLSTTWHGTTSQSTDTLRTTSMACKDQRRFSKRWARLWCSANWTCTRASWAPGRRRGSGENLFLGWKPHDGLLSHGLRNALAHFQQVMDTDYALTGVGHCAIAFTHDVLIWSDSPEQHMKDVGAVLNILQSCGLRAHPE